MCSTFESKLREADSELKQMDELKSDRDALLLRLRNAEEELTQLKKLLAEREQEYFVMIRISFYLFSVILSVSMTFNTKLRKKRKSKRHSWKK